MDGIRVFGASLYDERRLPALIASSALLLCLGVAFVVVGTQTMGVCYTKPCQLTAGLNQLWEVDYGTSFVAMLTGICFAAHPMAGLVLTFVGDKAGRFNSGVYLGFALMLAVNALASCILWGSKSNMARHLAHHIADAGADDGMIFNTDVTTHFENLSTITGVYFAVELFLITLVYASDAPFAPATSARIGYAPVLRGEMAGLVTEREKSMDDNPFVVQDEEFGGEPTMSI